MGEGIMMKRKKRSVILRERMKRLKIELKFRREDDTLAYFLPIEDEKLVLFLDIWAQDVYEWWQKMGRGLGMPFYKFTVKSLNRTYLHELIHWCTDDAQDEQCEKMALRLSFGFKTYYKIIEASIE